MHTSHTDGSNDQAEIRQVQNVALADATAKAGVLPWTNAMFKARTAHNTSTPTTLTMN